LSLEAEAVSRHILTLRGSERYLPVLQTLARLGPEPVPLPVLYEQVPTDLQTLKRLAASGLIELSEVEVWRDPLEGHLVEPDTPPALTDDQQRAWRSIQVGLKAWLESDSPPAGESPPVYLLYGVTGSGKTELYLRTLARVLAQGRQGIVLVPEISLTPQTVRRFIARFPGRVAIMHSKLSDGERYDTWQRARQGEFDVIVGSRLACQAGSAGSAKSSWKTTSTSAAAANSTQHHEHPEMSIRRMS
jgi:primosomal protein N' (replication factor Y)